MFEVKIQRAMLRLSEGKEQAHLPSVSNFAAFKPQRYVKKPKAQNFRLKK